ncbi:MAG: NAD(P)-dependent oxidoreductase [Cyanobacteria bacterium J06648_11]
MSVAPFKTCAIFGGTGFIGVHFARHLIANQLTERVILADINSLNVALWPIEVRQALDRGMLEYVRVDVREPIEAAALPERVDLIVNAAAIHREPGHAPFEYYETNILGAEHVCDWAESIDCTSIVFTSSIAPYGPTEDPKDERSLPIPITPYGCSKLIAEKIHVGWQKGDRGSRQLLIIRPGVVYGPGEGGNVTRLVRAVLGGYFAYTGNRHTRKAGGYVKELCHSILHVWFWQKKHHQGVVTFNFTADPALTIEEYVKAVCETVAIERFVPSFPYPFLLGASYLIAPVARLCGVKQPIEPVRMRKLVKSNNIQPRFLRDIGYCYRYSTSEAFADWQRERPSDWTF